MRFTEKYLLPIFYYLTFTLLGFVLFDSLDFILSSVHEYLSFAFPDLFRIPSQISEPEEYSEMRRWITVIIIAVILAVASYIALRVDNKRFEHIIDLTDGLYKMPRGMKIYLREFWLSDLIVTLLIPPLVTVPLYFVPEEFFARWMSIPFWCYDRLSEFFGIFDTVAILVILSLATRALVIFPTVKVWRAMWLTASVD